MKKKFNFLKAICLASVVGLATVSLTSCGFETADGEHTIYFYNTMGTNLQSPLKIAIQKFEETYPGWKVESSQIGNYDQVKSAIVADLVAGTQPDLAYCYADHVAQYLESETVVNMSKFIDDTNKLSTVVLEGDNWVEKEFGTIGYSAEEIADFVPGYYAEGYAKNYAGYEKYFQADDIITMPFQKSTEVLYYNADALIELGYKDADGNLVLPEVITWDWVWKVCVAAKAKWPSSTPLGYDSESNWFITACEQNGWGYTTANANDHFKFYNDNTQAFLADLRTKYQAGLFTTQEIYGSYSSNLFVKGVEDGGSVFSIGSSGGASHQATENFTWGVAPIPATRKADGTINNAAISQGPSLVMFETASSNNEQKQLMTWEFVKVLLSPEIQAGFASVSGYMPPRMSTYEVPSYAAFLEGDSIVSVTAKVAASMVDRYYTSPAFVGSSTARTQVGTALMYAVMGSKTPQQALYDAFKKCGGKLS